MIWVWTGAMLFCLLTRRWFEYRVSVSSALFVSFFGLFLLGFGLTCIGAYWGTMSILHKEYGKALLNLIPLGAGVFCTSMIMKPMLKLLGGMLRRGRP